MNRPTVAEIDRGGEIFRKARKDLGEDLGGFSLIDLLADNTGYGLDRCGDIARIICRTHIVSGRLRRKYGGDDSTTTRTEDLARIAYHGYVVAASLTGHFGEDSWDELSDKDRRGWRGAVVDVLLEFQERG